MGSTKKEFGNIQIEMDKGVDKEVYKCSHLSCDEYFLNYDDLQSHKVLFHGQLPKYFHNNTAINPKIGHFSIDKAKKLNFYSTKHVINTHLFILKLMFNNPNKDRVKK